MRTTIEEKDIKSIIGSWVVQVDGRKPDMDLTQSKNDGFWLEKRISYVNCLYGVDGMPHIKPEEQLVILSGIYYCHGVYTNSEFVKEFNNSPTYDKRDGTFKRWLRLLTPEEVDWLGDKLKSRIPTA
jgi:hypothetical protein